VYKIFVYSYSAIIPTIYLRVIDPRPHQHMNSQGRLTHLGIDLRFVLTAISCLGCNKIRVLYILGTRSVPEYQEGVGTSVCIVIRECQR
jgi:hypothetical protein